MTARGKRPSLTPEVAKKICAYIASGLTKKGAASAVCMSETTFYDCIRRGERDIAQDKDSIYSQFSMSVKEAEAEFKVAHVKNIEKFAKECSWQASAWLLERCYREEYGRSKMEMEISGTPGGEPVKTESRVQIYIPDNGRGK